MVNGEVYAIDAVCSHEGGPLEERILDGYEVECPWHGSRFDVRTGELRNPPADIPQLAYEVKIDSDEIMIKEKLQSEEQQRGVKKELANYEQNLFQKNKIEGTDIMSFKFSNQEENSNSGKSSFSYTAGQYFLFEIFRLIRA
jgi:glycine betaine catabolism B